MDTTKQMTDLAARFPVTTRVHLKDRPGVFAVAGWLMISEIGGPALVVRTYSHSGGERGTPPELIFVPAHELDAVTTLTLLHGDDGPTGTGQSS